MHYTSRRVLVVDDYADTVTATCAAIDMFGRVTCVGVGTGRAAIAMTHVFRPHVVLLDIGLPDMDGFIVAQEIRRLLPAVLIAVITGWSDPALRRRAFAGTDVDAFYLKPVNIFRLRPMICDGRHVT